MSRRRLRSRGVIMKYLSERRTWGLWDRLEREAGEYYQTLHDLKHELNDKGPITKVALKFSDLERQHRRLKSRFKVLALIGQCWVAPNPLRPITPGLFTPTLSDIVLCCADQVIGFGAIEGELEKESHNVRSR